MCLATYPKGNLLCRAGWKVIFMPYTVRMFLCSHTGRTYRFALWICFKEEYSVLWLTNTWRVIWLSSTVWREQISFIGFILLMKIIVNLGTKLLTDTLKAFRLERMSCKIFAMGRRRIEGGGLWRAIALYLPMERCVLLISTIGLVLLLVAKRHRIANRVIQMIDEYR